MGDIEQQQQIIVHMGFLLSSPTLKIMLGNQPPAELQNFQCGAFFSCTETQYNYKSYA